MAQNSDLINTRTILVPAAARWMGGGEPLDMTVIRRGLKLAEAIVENHVRLEHVEELKLFVAGYDWPEEVRAQEKLCKRFNKMTSSFVLTHSPSSMARAACELSPQRGRHPVSTLMDFDPFPVVDFFTGCSREKLQDLDPEILLPILQYNDPELRQQILRVLNRIKGTMPEEGAPTQ